MKAGITTDHLSTAQVTNAAIIGRAAEWHAAGHGIALAFVMQSWGSSPRPPGSVMLVRDADAARVPRVHHGLRHRHDAVHELVQLGVGH